MERAKLDKINYYAREQKIRELTKEEKAEQAELRREYVAEIRASFGAQLENTIVRYPDGTEKKLTQTGKNEKQ